MLQEDSTLNLVMEMIGMRRTARCLRVLVSVDEVVIKKAYKWLLPSQQKHLIDVHFTSNVHKDVYNQISMSKKCLWYDVEMTSVISRIRSLLEVEFRL